MATHQLTIAKASKHDIRATSEFLQMAHDVLKKELFGLSIPYEEWRKWDEDSEDYKLAIKIQKRIAGEEGIDIEDVDDRVVCYELLANKFTKASGSYYRVIISADILIDNIVPASSTILEFHPGFQFNHVDKEQ